MSYAINLTNGTKLTDIVDGSIDQTATDLTLIGKNLSNYGTFYNDNLVHLLENFSNVTAPNNPIVGQLWYDTGDSVLKIYNGIGFAPTGNTIVASALPPTLTTGGLWISSDAGQLYFNDGTATILAGPIYTRSQGVSGFVVSDIIDTNRINHSVVKLFVSNVLIGMYSKESFTPMDAIAGFAGTVSVGFNVGSYAGLSFNMTVDSAAALTENDLRYTPGSFLQTSGTTTGTSATLVLNATSTTYLDFGGKANVNYATANAFDITSTMLDQNVQVSTRSSNSSGTPTPAIFIKADTEYVGIYTSSPSAKLDVNGNVRVRGDLIVDGTSTTINSTNLSITDLLIELGVVDTPTNTTADGGGILLSAGTDGDKLLTWDLASLAWVSSEHLNIATGKSYMVGGDVVISGTALGSVITTATGLIQVGTLTSLNVSNLSINGSTIAASTTSDSIYLTPSGAGTIDASSTRITNVGTPSLNGDATTKLYVDERVASASVAISLDTTGMSNTDIASTYLRVVFPNSEHVASTICRAVCTDGSTVTIRQFELSGSGIWEYIASL